MITPTGTFRDATLLDMPVGSRVRVIAYGYGARKIDCGQTGTVIHHNRVRAIVHLTNGEVRPIDPIVLTPLPTETTNGAMRQAMLRPTVRRLAESLRPTSAQDLKPGQVIAFGDDVCTVLGVDPASDVHVSLVTESPDGSQFIDYVSGVRIFTVIESLATREQSPEEAIRVTLSRRGWTVRRCEPIREDSPRYLIMAYRDLPGIERREYVVASLLPTDREWSNGDYFRDAAAADARYRFRQSLTRPGSLR